MYSADKKKVILQIADIMFARHGFCKTTMDEIAKASHMAKSSLYYYFQSKEEIFIEVINQDSEKFRKKLDLAINAVSSPQQKIIEYVNTRLKYLKELTNYYTTLSDEYLKHYFFIEEIRIDFYKHEKQTLIKLLRDGVSQNAFIVSDLDLTARMISIIIKGLEYQLFTLKDDFNLEYEIAQLMNILFQGISKK